jgi:hypothetical protein
VPPQGPDRIWTSAAKPIVDVSLLQRLQPAVGQTLGFARAKIDDLPAAVRDGLDRLPALRGLEQGQRVAVTAGSRGISNIAVILKTSCEYLRGLGVKPVVVAAMGSHGGGTAEGQRDLLGSLGITGHSLGGVQVACGVETEVIGRTAEGLAVHVDRNAVRDIHGILVINRVKPHTAFRGSTESGLLKMLAVGLGKKPGATAVHGRGPAQMCASIRSIADVMLSRLPVLGGLAILENGYEETAEIVPLAAQEFLSREETLLARARELMPRLPLDGADVLIVERLGKEISGTGMDTNVIGRWGEGDPGPAAASFPVFRRVVVLDLTPASHGNATGLGLADFTTDRLVKSIDRLTTYTNCLTTTLIDRCRLPLFFPDDRQAIAAAVTSLGAVELGEVTYAQVKDTLHLDRIRVSANLAGRLRPFPGISVAPAGGPPLSLQFDGAGSLARIER